MTARPPGGKDGRNRKGHRMHRRKPMERDPKVARRRLLRSSKIHVPPETVTNRLYKADG